MQSKVIDFKQTLNAKLSSVLENEQNFYQSVNITPIIPPRNYKSAHLKGLEFLTYCSSNMLANSQRLASSNLSVIYFSDPNLGNGFEIACANQNLEIIEYLCELDKNFAFDTDSHGRNAFLNSIINKKLKTAEVLLYIEPNIIFSTDNYGKTCFDYAFQKNDIQILQFFCHVGPILNIDSLKPSLKLCQDLLIKLISGQNKKNPIKHRSL